MKRREFLTILSAATAWPLAVRAQQSTVVPVIGLFNVASPDGFANYVAAFHDGLKEVGYVEGQNVVIEYRWADGHYDRLPEMAVDLVRRQVSVIIANTPANVAAKNATSTIPIVFTTGVDPVELGLVSNLRRPGANVTGVSQLNAQLGLKRLELAHELMPTATAVVLLVNPSDGRAAERLSKEMQGAAGPLGLRIDVVRGGTDEDIESAFAGFAHLKAGVMVIGADAYFSAKSQLLAELSQRYAVPAIYQTSEFTKAGGLMSYGGSVTDSYRLAGVYAGRILKGEKPADLPVQQSTKVQLAVNLKTAKALGITVPLTLLGRADEVIE
jgi:putative tryptophan/tyrosine transport system substrate-binding protein